MPQRVEMRRNNALCAHALQVIHCVFVARESIQQIQIHERNLLRGHNLPDHRLYVVRIACEKVHQLAARRDRLLHLIWFANRRNDRRVLAKDAQRRQLRRPTVSCSTFTHSAAPHLVRGCPWSLGYGGEDSFLLCPSNLSQSTPPPPSPARRTLRPPSASTNSPSPSRPCAASAAAPWSTPAPDTQQKTDRRIPSPTSHPAHAARTRESPALRP